MKVFSIIGDKKMRENISPKIINALKDAGNTVGFIKRTDNISSNSQTKKAIIWGDHQSLYYHEEKSSLGDLLKLFDEDYVVVDDDTKCNVPKLLMYEEIDIENTADVNELGNMHNLKRRGDVFFVADKDTAFDDIMEAIKSKVFDVLPDYEVGACYHCGMTCREMNNAILQGKAVREDCNEGRPDVELQIGQKTVSMTPLVQSILKNSVKAVATELDEYKDGEELTIVIRK